MMRIVVVSVGASFSMAEGSSTFLTRLTAKSKVKSERIPFQRNLESQGCKGEVQQDEVKIRR